VGDLQVLASGSQSQMTGGACIVIVKEANLEHVITELDTFTALFRTSLTDPESMLSVASSVLVFSAF